MDSQEIKDELTEIKNQLTDMTKQMSCLIEINSRLTHELVLLKGGGTISNGTNVEVLGQNDDIKLTPTPKPKGVTFKEDKDEAGTILLSGKTFSYKDTIKAYGGRWNPSKKVWSINTDNSEQLKEALIESGVECN